LRVLQGRSLRDRLLHVVEERHLNVETAQSKVIDEYTRRLDAVADTYLRERAADERNT
jgi:phosphoenolpyruvate-protein kinase (PTS system EI component)